MLAFGELLAGRTDRAVRALLGAVPRPRRRARQARRSARRRERAVPRVLEPRVHAARPEPGERGHPAPGEEHRYRPRPEPDGVDPPEQALGVRDRPVRPADLARGRALGPPLRRGVRHGSRAQDPRRPRSRDDVPHRRRRRPLERGARLRAAADHAPRDPGGPGARARPRLSDRLRRDRHRADGVRVSGASRARRQRAQVARVRGGELRPDTRAGEQAARRADRPRQ